MSENFVLIVSMLLTAFVIVFGIGFYFLGSTLFRKNRVDILKEEGLVSPDAEVVVITEMQAPQMPQAQPVQPQVTNLPPIQQVAPTEILFDEYGNPIQTIINVAPAPPPYNVPPSEQAPPQNLNVQPAPPPYNVPPAEQFPPQNLNVQPAPPPIAQAPQELVQRPAILDMNNPVTQLSEAQTNAEIAAPSSADLPEAALSDNKSSFGVRYSSNSSNRVLRDKRSSRNASN